MKKVNEVSSESCLTNLISIDEKLAKLNVQAEIRLCLRELLSYAQQHGQIEKYWKEIQDKNELKRADARKQQRERNRLMHGSQYMTSEEDIRVQQPREETSSSYDSETESGQSVQVSFDMPSQDEINIAPSKTNSDLMTIKQRQKSTFSGSKSRLSKRTRQEMEADQFNPVRFLALSLKERVAERKH